MNRKSNIPCWMTAMHVIILLPHRNGQHLKFVHILGASAAIIWKATFTMLLVSEIIIWYSGRGFIEVCIMLISIML